MSQATFAAIVQREGDHYVAQCPELEGSSVGEAIADAGEAVEAFLDAADPERSSIGGHATCVR